ncbi:cell adhesion molecule 1-like isoform X2 [Acanthochromis polyacanthus]|uniref:cell adhesion molecule 1-like isoform X2 n=1 Tax=Acanthochromis polyacanthus TaxID=80966 RepID=UPI00223488DF|nr:cell adhesion molecule 1-like isoform X2 [Acanthochromis polyacanthus]
MLFHFILMVVSLMTFLHNHHVSGSDANCAYKPVFTPSRLVVKYGDPTSATCVACVGVCNKHFGLEKPVGDVTVNGTTLSWTVGRLTEWNASPMCFYNTESGDQCFTVLPVTVYQPPENVSISFENHAGPMFEHNQYTLECTVENVAPAGNLTVTFFRGRTELSRQEYNSKQDKPENVSFPLNVNVSKEDDGAQYWCEAKLELGPEGPQPPPVVTSERITATVHYGPHLQKTGNLEPIKITEGQSLQLNCSAVGNPSPSYVWTIPPDSQSYHSVVFDASFSVVTIKSVGFEHKGQYTCHVSSEDRTESVTFTVDVQGNIIPYIILGVVIAAVVIIVIVVMVYFGYYRHNRMGQYNLKDVFRLHKRQAVPLEA